MMLAVMSASCRGYLPALMSAIAFSINSFMTRPIW